MIDIQDLSKLKTVEIEVFGIDVQTCCSLKIVSNTSNVCCSVTGIVLEIVFPLLRIIYAKF